MSSARRHDPWFNRKRRSARAAALDRPELRAETTPRRSASGVTSAAVKAVDPETRELIDEAMLGRRAS